MRAGLPLPNGLQHHVIGRAALQRIQGRYHVFRKALVAGRVWVEDFAAAKSTRRTELPDDEKIALDETCRFNEKQLHKPIFPWRDGLTIEKPNTGESLHGAGMECNHSPMFQRTRRGRQEPDAYVRKARRGKHAGQCEYLSAIDFINVNPAYIDGNAIAGQSVLDLVLVTLQPAYAAADVAGNDVDVVTDVELTVEQRAGDHGAKATEGEGPIDRQARAAYVPFCFRICEQVIEDTAQFV